jgi:hypothetical protein
MKEWLTIDEILERDIPNFPRERSALTRKASRENWVRQKRETQKRGVTYEYLLPEHAVTTNAPAKSKNKVDRQASLLSILTEQLEVLSDDEINALIILTKRKGAEVFLYLLDEDNIELMRMDPIVKEKILGKQPDARDAALNAEEKRERGANHESQAIAPHLTSEKKQAS